jgi:hypothetical protein
MEVHTLNSLIGMAGAIVLTIGGVPLALKAIKNGVDTTDRTFLVSWLVGEVLLLLYVLLDIGFNLPLFSGYAFDILLAVVTIRYNLWPRVEIREWYDPAEKYLVRYYYTSEGKQVILYSGEVE